MGKVTNEATQQSRVGERVKALILLRLVSVKQEDSGLGRRSRKVLYRTNQGLIPKLPRIIHSLTQILEWILIKFDCKLFYLLL